MSRSRDHVDFGAPASLRKWPSLGNQRSVEAVSPYLVLDGTLDKCLRKLMAHAASTRHLYEIHTAPQPPLVEEVMAGDTVVELDRVRDLFEVLAPPTDSGSPGFRPTTDWKICTSPSAAESSAMAFTRSTDNFPLGTPAQWIAEGDVTCNIQCSARRCARRMVDVRLDTLPQDLPWSKIGPRLVCQQFPARRPSFRRAAQSP
jgi:hypothetical protein